MEDKKRGQWQSSFGFLMAAVGSAVGLGNLWGFPYKMGKSGGFAFLLLYLIFVLTVGFVVMVGELAIGRFSQLDAVGSYKKINKRFGFIGGFGILAAFLILSFYSVLGGWVLKYAATYVMELFGSGFGDMSGEAFFVGFITNPIEPLIWLFLFIGTTAVVVAMGVEKGIEKYSKIMMPALFIMLLIITLRSLTLPGAMKGVAFMFKPDFSVFTSWESFSKVGATALAQMFFSLSLGMGAMLTYGSYLGKEENLQKSALIIPTLDTLVAVFAGLAIMPAVFAFGLDPGQGPGLMFVTLKEVFTAMPFGNFFGLLFFVLVFFAALTSSISLLEVATAYFVDNFKISRKKTAVIASLAAFILGIPSSLGQGVWSHIKLILGMDILDSVDFISEYTLMPLGALCMCIFIGWIWGADKVVKEVELGGRHKFNLGGYFSFMVKYVTPILVAILLYSSCIHPIISFISGK
ncbi:MAG: sodium-dependent transporter [Filifactoraceae bacterium]